jgi:hypothetical protein
MSFGKKILWTVTSLIILCVAGYAFLKYVATHMDVVYSEYPTISEYQGKGWVPFSTETLKNANNIRQKSDVDSNDSFIRFFIEPEDIGKFISGAKIESINHRAIACRNTTPECILFKNDPDQIIRFDLIRTSHLGEDSFVFLLDPVSGEVVGGGRQFPFRKYLVFD